MASAILTKTRRVSEVTPQSVPIRDAATIVLVRREADGFRVLMGQRGKSAAFMPNKFVFPGGAVDKDDLALGPASDLSAETRNKLKARTSPEIAEALPYAAVRELWEETGLRLGKPDSGAAALRVPESWRDFFAAGLRPHISPLRMFFRAITPLGRPRRFDARFFLVDASELMKDSDADQIPDGELRHLQWLRPTEARDLPLPFITNVVLSELEDIYLNPERPSTVPFFDHDAAGSHFRLL